MSLELTWPARRDARNVGRGFEAGKVGGISDGEVVAGCAWESGNVFERYVAGCAWESGNVFERDVKIAFINTTCYHSAST